MVSKAKWEAQIRAMPPDELLARWADEYRVLSADVHRIHWTREVFEALDTEIVSTHREGSGFFLERFLRPMYFES